MKSATKLIAALGVLAIGALAGVLAMPVPRAPEAQFVTLAGETFQTSSLRGKVAVVNFWATSCGTCLAEIPDMARSYQRFSARGYEFVAVAMRYDSPDRVAQFAQSRALPYKVALDSDGAIAKRFGNIHITPTTFVIDKRGRVLKRFLGAPDWKEFDAMIERALAEPA